jgi:hypothetical protein
MCGGCVAVWLCRSERHVKGEGRKRISRWFLIHEWQKKIETSWKGCKQRGTYRLLAIAYNWPYWTSLKIDLLTLVTDSYKELLQLPVRAKSLLLGLLVLLLLLQERTDKPKVYFIYEFWHTLRWDLGWILYGYWKMALEIISSLLVLPRAFFLFHIPLFMPQFSLLRTKDDFIMSH